MSRLDPRRLLGNKFVKDTATLQVATLLNQIGQVACSVLIAFLLGAHEQGLYALALSLQAFLFNLLNVGVLQATIVQVAAAAVRDQRSKLTQWIAFLVKAYLVINVAVICVAYFALPPLAERIYGERLGHEAARELGLWGFWLCFFPLIDTARVAIFAALQGTRRMLPIARLDNMMEIVRVFLVISGALITNSPRGAVLGEIAARVVVIPIALSLYRGARQDGLGYLPGVREILAELRGIPLRRGIRLGLRVGMLKNTHTIFLSVLPSLFLGALAGASWVTWFNVARRFMDLPSLLMQAVTRTALPALSEIAGLRDGQRFRRLFLRITGLGAALITAGTLLFLPFVKPLTQWLYPPDYVDPVFGYAAILAIGNVLVGGLVASEAFYIVTNQMKKSLILTAIGAVVTVPANILLMTAYPQSGVAWGQVVYASWSLAHYAYGWWWLSRDKHATMWATPPARAADLEPDLVGIEGPGQA